MRRSLSGRSRRAVRRVFSEIATQPSAGRYGRRLSVGGRPWPSAPPPQYPRVTFLAPTSQSRSRRRQRSWPQSRSESTVTRSGWRPAKSVEAGQVIGVCRERRRELPRQQAGPGHRKPRPTTFADEACPPGTGRNRQEAVDGQNMTQADVHPRRKGDGDDGGRTGRGCEEAPPAVRRPVPEEDGKSGCEEEKEGDRGLDRDQDGKEVPAPGRAELAEKEGEFALGRFVWRGNRFRGRD